MRHKIAAAGAMVVLAACGGSSGSTTTTAGGVTTTGAVVTTTTATAQTTTTADPHAHPEFGVSWDDVWPSADATATYEADGETLTGRMEYGVEFRGMTVDRFVVGTPEPGSLGQAIYLDRSEPWVIRVIASESFHPTVACCPAVREVFEDPLVFDLTIGVGDTENVEASMILELPNIAPTELGVTYEVRPVEVIDGVETPFGALDGVLRVEVGVGGELIGGGIFDVVLMLHAEQFIVLFEGAPAFNLLQLTSPWG